MINNFKKYIQDQVEDYFEGTLGIRSNQTFIDEDGNEFDISMDDLADSIVDKMGPMVLEFNQTASFGEVVAGRSQTSGLVCPTCYRPHGEWKSATGGQVGFHDVLKGGVSILILNDFGA